MVVKHKDKYKYIKLDNPSRIKQVVEAGDLYLGECIKKSKVYNDIKKEQMKTIDDSAKLIASVANQLKKLDVLLHERVI